MGDGALADMVFLWSLFFRVTHDCTRFPGGARESIGEVSATMRDASIIGDATKAAARPPHSKFGENA